MKNGVKGGGREGKEQRAKVTPTGIGEQGAASVWAAPRWHTRPASVQQGAWRVDVEVESVCCEIDGADNEGMAALMAPEVIMKLQI